MTLILALDPGGQPRRWMTLEEAVCAYATDMVLWEAGEKRIPMRGGWNGAGEQSLIEVSSIVSLAGEAERHRHAPKVTRRGVFGRDRHVCAYCAQRFPEEDLTLDHILPESRGGKRTWMNLVTACRRDNAHKAAMTPEEAGMQLVYAPYVPNRHEAVILANRRILADQMSWLLAGVPKHSRLLA